MRGSIGKLLGVAMLSSVFSLTNVSFAQSASTPSTIPSSGNAVKAGDVIIWNVNKPITTDKSTETQSNSDAEDQAAAAAALQTAAHSAIEAAAIAASAPNAPSGASAQLQAAVAAATQADTEAKKAAAAAAPKPTIGPTTVTAAEQLVKGAETAALDALKVARAADDQMITDKAAAAKANDADKGLNAKADQSTKLAAVKDALAATAEAYLTAATAAYEKVVASSISGKVCFPADSRFNVTSIVAASKSSTKAATSNSKPTKSGSATASNDAAGGTTTTPSNTQLVSGYFPVQSKLGSVLHPLHRNGNVLPPATGDDKHSGEPSRVTSPCAEAPKLASANETYSFTSDQLAKVDFFREGFTWGGMVIPYKFYFTDKSIKSNSSVVGFAGYEGWLHGLSVSTVLALGGGTAPSSVSTATSTGSLTGGTSKTTTTTLVTYTAALGFVVAFGDGTVKGGLMFGRDFQGNAAAFPYENKTWMALSIGAGF